MESANMWNRQARWEDEKGPFENSTLQAALILLKEFID